jgi:hypothetical protein
VQKIMADDYQRGRREATIENGLTRADLERKIVTLMEERYQARREGAQEMLRLIKSSEIDGDASAIVPQRKEDS